jgi:hypothetical protein
MLSALMQSAVTLVDGSYASALTASTQPLRILTSGELSALQPLLARVVTKARAPLLLRLLFHDAGTYSVANKDGGPNGSIQFELDRPENGGLRRGWEIVKEVLCRLAQKTRAQLGHAYICRQL